MFLFLLASCQKDVDVENVKSKQSHIDPGIINLEYEVETLTVPSLQNADDANAQQKIQAMAFSERNKIKMSAYADGTSAWRIEKQKPKNDLSVQHETPPSDLREVKITEVDRAGMGRFYDDKGALLFTHKVPIASLKDAVANVFENPNAIFTAMGVNTAENVAKILARAKAQGSIVQDLGNGMTSVRTGKGKGGESTLRQKDEADNLTSVDIFNTALGIMMGSTLYDEQENIVCQVYYSYVYNEQNKLVPEATFLQSWDIDPITGEKRKTETHTYFENVTATININ